VTTFKPRYANGVYRDCKWCKGNGCLSCKAEADKEYKRQFPDGPKPFATISTDDPKAAEKLMAILTDLLGPAGKQDGEEDA